MPDNVDIRTNAGKGVVVATDQRTISAEPVHIQRFDEIGSQNIASGQKLLTPIPTQIVGDRDTRKRLVMANHGDTDVFIGPNAVNDNTGMKIPPGGGLTLYVTGSVYGVTDGLDGVLHYVEEYD